MDHSLNCMVFLPLRVDGIAASRQPWCFVFVSRSYLGAFLVCRECRRGTEESGGKFMLGGSADCPSKMNKLFVDAVVSQLKRCRDVEEGRRIHNQIIRNGLEHVRYVCNFLIQMYGKYGALEHARSVFDGIQSRNSFSWSIMIGAYVQHGELEEAANVFRQMPVENVVICNAMITAYAQQGLLDKAFQLFHGMTNRDVVSWTAMIAAYAKHGKLKDAFYLFEQMPERDDVSWTTMITACSQHALYKEAHMLFQEMPKPNVVAWTAMIGVYAKQGMMDEALRIFQQIPHPDVIAWNAMITAFIQNGFIEEAIQVFQEMPKRNLATWNAMIAGYAQEGRIQEAFELLGEMKIEDARPNNVTFLSLLEACGRKADLVGGKEVHRKIIDHGLESNIVVGSAVVDMYSKCGSLQDAKSVFAKMPKKNAITWNAMLSGYAHHENAKVLQILHEMQTEGLLFDKVTFAIVLSAFCHAGLEDEGCHYFVSMGQNNSITTTMEHCSCMIVLLGQSGKLDEAYSFIIGLPFEPGPIQWKALLNCCKIYVDLERGENATDHVLQLEPQDATPYVLLSTLYRIAGKWDDAVKVRKAINAEDFRNCLGSE